MKSKLIAAFDATCQGFSPDRVVADPDLNANFVAEALRLGLTDAAANLNRNLLNLRKRGLLPGRKSKRTSFHDEENYRFAAEMAVRFLERRDGISLDSIICDPERAAEFDSFAARLAPGFSPLQYRWAALNLRKTSRLKPELLARVSPPISIATYSINGLDLALRARSTGAIPLFHFVGCTLRRRGGELAHATQEAPRSLGQQRTCSLDVGARQERPASWRFNCWRRRLARWSAVLSKPS